MTSEEKRQRHKEGHRSRMEAAREAEARARKRQRLVVLGTIVVIAVAVIAAAVLLLGDDGGADTTATTTTVPLDDPSATDPAATEAVTLPDPPPGGTIEGETPCPAEDGSEERISTFAQAPPTCIDEGAALQADIVTSKGPITIALDAEAAPTMVNNFVVLARYHYFDGLPFHRLVPDFVAQTGSSGMPDYANGGPGYGMPDIETPESYTAGDVAMARGPAGVSGSQFFLVASDAGGAGLTPVPADGEASPAQYPLVGRVTQGQELVAELASLGDRQTEGTPTEVVTMDSVTIRPTA